MRKFESFHFFLNCFVIRVVIARPQWTFMFFSFSIRNRNRIMRSFTYSTFLIVWSRSQNRRWCSWFSSSMTRFFNRVWRTFLSSWFNFWIVKAWPWSLLIIRKILRWLTDCVCWKRYSDFIQIDIIRAWSRNIIHSFEKIRAWTSLRAYFSILDSLFDKIVNRIVICGSRDILLILR